MLPVSLVLIYNKLLTMYVLLLSAHNYTVVMHTVHSVQSISR